MIDVPAPREPGSPYRVDVVCLGNICRSPMAHVVLAGAVAEAGLDDRIEVTSSGTGSWHVGEGMDQRAAATLIAAGYDPTGHRAEHYDADRVGRHDLVLAMDDANARDLRALGVGDRLRAFRDADPEGRGEVPDPWYGGQQGFADVLAMVERTAGAWVQGIAARLDRREEGR